MIGDLGGARATLARVTTRPFARLLLAALALLPACSRGNAPAPAPTPPAARARNVVLIVIDTLRADHLGAYGHARATSPRIDAFARESAVFERAYSHSPWTMPSVASMFTSLEPKDHGIADWKQPLDRGLLTLAEVLQARGFRTEGYVSHGVLSRLYQFDQGFDVYDASVVEGRLPREITTAREVTDLALQALERPLPEPFFLWVHYFDPHDAYLKHDGHDFGERPIDLHLRGLEALVVRDPGGAELVAHRKSCLDAFYRRSDVDRAFDTRRAACAHARSDRRTSVVHPEFRSDFFGGSGDSFGICGQSDQGSVRFDFVHRRADHRAAQVLRRRHDPLFRQLHPQRRRARRPDRPQRCRQDDVLQRDDRRLHPDRGHDPLQGPARRTSDDVFPRPEREQPRIQVLQGHDRPGDQRCAQRGLQQGRRRTGGLGTVRIGPFPVRPVGAGRRGVRPLAAARASGSTTFVAT